MIAPEAGKQDPERAACRQAQPDQRTGDLAKLVEFFGRTAEPLMDEPGATESGDVRQRGRLEVRQPRPPITRPGRRQIATPPSIPR